MATLIKMPKLSDTMEEGGISEWFKKEGEDIEEGEPLLSIETDKATMEYPSPLTGTVLKILVKEGEQTSLQAPIAFIGEKGEIIDDSQLLEPNADANSSDQKQPQTQSHLDSFNKTADTAKHAPDTSSSMIKASPLAKKIASLNSINLGDLEGSGPHGRIIERDVRGAIELTQKNSAIEQISNQPATLQKPQSNSDTSNEFFDQFAEDDRLPHSMMRKTIAKRLVAAKNEIPHYYVTVSADMTKILRWRENINQTCKKIDDEVSKVSINDLLILACAKTIRKHPKLNSSWHGDYLITHRNIHIAIAVAMPTGLITPTIRYADRLGVLEIAKKSKELVKQANEGKLQPEQFENGTFTISNLGMTKVESFTAIINPPQSAILAVGACQAVPIVSSLGSIEVQKRINLTLSCDHRVADGMDAARFLETLIANIENPLEMLV